MLETIPPFTGKMKKADYKDEYKSLVNKLVILQQEAKNREIGMVVLFEGWKGAGKGSRISDILYNLDARGTSVHVTQDFNPVEAKLAAKEDFGSTSYYPAMQQFWKALGTRDGITFFDRGWYSTVTEHVINALGEGKKEEAAARRLAEKHFDSIESFERQLTADGYIVVKFFLHISEETQRKRLVDLYSDPATKWRVTADDLANLVHYESVYNIYDELIEESQFDFAKWVLLNAEDKRQVNLEVVRTLVDRFEEALNKEQDAGAAAAAAAAKANSASQTNASAAGLEREELSVQAIEESKKRAEIASSFAPKESRFEIQKNYPKLEDVDHTLSLERAKYKAELKYEQQRLHS